MVKGSFVEQKQAQDSIKAEALRCGMFYVNERWLGGMQPTIIRLKAEL